MPPELHQLLRPARVVGRRTFSSVMSGVEGVPHGRPADRGSSHLRWATRLRRSALSFLDKGHLEYQNTRLVNKRKEEGCIAVEMELAGVQAICDFYGFELYDFLVAGDVLIEGNYETDGLSAANHDLDKLFLALQIAKNMRIEGR